MIVDIRLIDLYRYQPKSLSTVVWTALCGRYQVISCDSITAWRLYCLHDHWHLKWLRDELNLTLRVRCNSSLIHFRCLSTWSYEKVQTLLIFRAIWGKYGTWISNKLSIGRLLYFANKHRFHILSQPKTQLFWFFRSQEFRVELTSSLASVRCHPLCAHSRVPSRARIGRNCAYTRFHFRKSFTLRVVHIQYSKLFKGLACAVMSIAKCSRMKP